VTPAASLLARLRAAGFALSAAPGRLLVDPVAKLTAEQKDEVITHRGELIALLLAEQSATAGLSDADIDAVALFCADEAGDEPAALRRCVLLRWPCGTVLALSQEALDAWPRGGKPAGTGATKKAARPGPAAKEELF
jgi:hypothetical protein